MDSTPRSESKKRAGLLPVLCNLLGCGMLLFVILVFFPLTVPRLFGYEIYHVTSGSMQPVLPVGSAIYVERCDPVDVAVGDIIAFWSGDAVIAHRVAKNRVVEGEFVTKGDANTTEDFSPTPYSELIGRVRFHLPALGAIMALCASPLGKLYLLLIASCGAMFNALADRIRYNRRSRA